MLGRKLVAEIVTHERRRDSTLKRSLLFLYKLALSDFSMLLLQRISRKVENEELEKYKNLQLIAGKIIAEGNQL